MPRPVNPVNPRRLDERVYDKSLRRLVLTPLMAQLRSGLSEASAASLALEIIDGVFRGWHTAGLVDEEVAVHSARVSGYHRRRLIQTFRTALGIDIRPRSLSEKQCSKRYTSLVEYKDANYSTTKSRLL